MKVTFYIRDGAPWVSIEADANNIVERPATEGDRIRFIRQWEACFVLKDDGLWATERVGDRFRTRPATDEEATTLQENWPPLPGQEPAEPAAEPAEEAAVAPEDQPKPARRRRRRRPAIPVQNDPPEDENYDNGEYEQE